MFLMGRQHCEGEGGGEQLLLYIMLPSVIIVFCHNPPPAVGTLTGRPRNKLSEKVCPWKSLALKKFGLEKVWVSDKFWCLKYFVFVFSVHLIFLFWIQCALAHFLSFGFSVHHPCCHNLNPKFPGDSKKHPIFIPVKWYGLGGFGFDSSLFGSHGEKVCLFNLYIILEIFDWYFEYIDVLLVKAVTTWKLPLWTKYSLH